MGLTSSNVSFPFRLLSVTSFQCGRRSWLYLSEGHLDSRFRQLAYEPLACAVIGFYLDTEFPSERIIKFGCGGGGGSPCGYDQPLVPHSLVDIPYKPTVSTGYKIGNFTVGESEQQKFF